MKKKHAFAKALFGALGRQDWLAWGAVAALLGTGLAFIYSASWRGEDTGIVGAWFPKQIQWVCIGAAAGMALALADYRVWIRHAWWIFAAALALLGAVLVFGTKVYGASRWIGVGGMPVQPSEFAKIALVVLLARLLGDPALPPQSFGLMATGLALTALPFALILVEPDLGTAMVLVPVALAMLFAAGMKWRYFFGLAALGAASAPLAWWLVLGDYQKERVMTFLDPSRDPLNSGWNAMQSAIAVGSGGLTGKGFLNGTQNVLGFLPRTVSPSDFIFPVLAEETGFAGACLLLLAFATLLLCWIRTAATAGDAEGSLLATGMAALLFAHVFINIGMTIGLLPITGLPLPYVSSGGSFMLSMMAAAGLVQSVHARRERRGERE